MKNSHLVPQAVIDAVIGMSDENNNSTIKSNFEDRVKAIREFCDTALRKNLEQKKSRR